MKNFRVFTNIVAVATLAAAIATSASAQNYDKVEIKTEKLSPTT